ncbi:MAG: ABC transporter ATP-binding protein, partial [Alphaproteobacteria bacterium]
MTAGDASPFLGLAHISKLFGSFRAVDDLSLDVVEGEVYALLGPSGCGKSTTLRQIAGLDSPDTGTITLCGNVLFSAADGIYVPPQRRNMGMVFQSYAIWPHLTVGETVAYPLRLRRVPGAEVEQAVHDILAQVGLDGFADRPSTTLSGGQQQRVALARALVYKPDVLLLDEPFSNLDVKLREQMRVELKQLQRQVGVTVILVTHDQSEALSLADRVAVMNAGRIEQVGEPVELYENPVSPFVRDFIGLSTCFDVTVSAQRGGEAEVRCNGGDTPLVAGAFRGVT